MERGAVWKLRTSTIGVCAAEDLWGHDRRIPVTLPANATLKILDTPTEAAFVEVEWERKHVLVFRIDLRERGERVAQSLASPAST